MKTATFEFDITQAEKTIAWFYSGVKQPEYQKARISLFNVPHNEWQGHRIIKAMLFKCREHMARIVIYHVDGVISVRIDDEYGWKP